jgi:hypothetical protein
MILMPAFAQTFSRITDGVEVTDTCDSRAVNWIDYDADGDLDLFVTNGTQGGANNFLYRNDGGTFTRLTGDSIGSDHRSSDGATWGDFDNDGDLDCFVANWYNQNNLPYRNNGDGSFTLITGSPLFTDRGYSESASWCDYDGDGLLDLVVANSAGLPLVNFLYHNDGGGTFTRVTDGPIANDATYPSRCPAWADYDNDGDQDLLIANEDLHNEYLYRNDGGGTFVRITADPLVQAGGSTTSASWGDYDNDGNLDVILANAGSFDGPCGEAEALFRGNGDGTFTQVHDSAIAAAGGCSFGSLWGDFDNDADLDLLITNGFDAGGNANFYFSNNGDGSFTRVTDGPLATDSGWSYGCAAADFDRDGDLDIFVAHWQPSGDHNAFYLNHATGENANHWLTLKLAGTTSNRSAIGARVRVKAHVGGRDVWQMREVAGQSGYCGQTLEQHFGLRDAAIIDSLWIRWPSGLVETYTGIAANQYLTITENGGYTAVQKPARPLPLHTALVSSFPNPFNAGTEIRFTLPQPAQAHLTVYDLTGRQVALLLDEFRAAGDFRVLWKAEARAICHWPAGRISAGWKPGRMWP